METAISSHEVLVCQTCGAEGFTNAFVYCVKCLGFVIHRYCLDVLPETSDEFVSWFCDDCKLPVCKPPLPYHSTSPPEHDRSQSREEDLSLSAFLNTTHPKKKRKKKPLKKRKILSLVGAGKDKECDPRPDPRKGRSVVLGLQKRTDDSLRVQKEVTTSLQHVKPSKDKKLLKKLLQNKRESVSLVGKVSDTENRVETPSNSSQKEAFVNSDSGTNQITPQSAELDSNCYSTEGDAKRKRDTICVDVKEKKHNSDRSIGPSSCESSCTDVTSKNEEGITRTEEGLRGECGPDYEKLVSNSSSTEKELNERIKEFKGNAYTSQPAYLENNVQNIMYQPASPEPEPVWRGSFNITQTDYDLFEGFVGHLSNKVCSRAREEATTLPSLLSLQMDSRANLWPNSFMQSMPTVEVIAVYFFPGDTKHERDFEQLVNDMIDDDLAMKATSKNAELLIFTSTVLPKFYWRFQGNYYLWGVFKRKSDVPVAKSANDVTSEKEILERVKTVKSHSPQSPLCNYR